MASELITEDMGEICGVSSPGRDQVQGVPHTVINGKDWVIGARPELELASAVLEAVGK